MTPFDIHPNLKRKSLILKRNPNQLFIYETLFINWRDTKNSLPV